MILNDSLVFVWNPCLFLIEEIIRKSCYLELTCTQHPSQNKTDKYKARFGQDKNCVNEWTEVQKSKETTWHQQRGRKGGRGSSKLKLFPSKVPDTKVAFTKTFDIASWLLAKAVFFTQRTRLGFKFWISWNYFLWRVLRMRLFFSKNDRVCHTSHISLVQ